MFKAVRIVVFCLVWGQGLPLFAEELPEPAMLQALKASLPGAPIWDEALAQSCQAYAQELIERQSLTHRDRHTQDAAGQLIAQGYPLGEFGEILGAGRDWRDVLAAWHNSPTHHQILASRWQRWGWGQVQTATTSVYVVRFWRP